MTRAAVLEGRQDELSHVGENRLNAFSHTTCLPGQMALAVNKKQTVPQTNKKFEATSTLIPFSFSF